MGEFFIQNDPLVFKIFIHKITLDKSKFFLHIHFKIYKKYTTILN